MSSRTLWLSPKAPSDLTIDIPAERARFAQLRYGSSDSRRVALVLTEDEAGQCRLFVDADRDRRLSAAEQVAGDGSRWQFPLLAEFATAIPDEARSELRHVLVRRGKAGPTLTLATLGYLRGELEFTFGAAQARVMDMDANGRFGDAEDVLWCDTNQDGRWNRFLERMASTSVIRVREQRYRFATDEYGRGFQVQLLQGTGKIRLDLGIAPDLLVGYRLLLVGRDGFAFSATDSPHLDEIPVGEYRIASMSVTLRDPEGGVSWNYLFSGERSGALAWNVIAKDRETAMHPLQGLRFSAEIGDPQPRYQPGDSLAVTPRLRARSGLLLNNCWRGDDRQSWNRDGGVATIRIRQGDQETIACTSGFA